jgi:hypothetical protein
VTWKDRVTYANVLCRTEDTFYVDNDNGDYPALHE